MDLLQYPVALIVTLGVLVTIHELGHYLIARASGVRVLRFSVGFGRPIWSRTDSRGTEFAVAAIPLGGYVRMLDSRDPDFEERARPGDVAYRELDVWWRIAIALGGPLANFALAAVVYWVLAMAGTTTFIPVLGPVAEGSPLAAAGMEAGLEIVAVDDAPTPGWQQVNLALAGRLGDTGHLRFEARPAGTQGTRVYEVAINEWERGADTPDLFASLGIEPVVPAVVGEVVADSAAERAGFATDDKVVSFDGAEVADWYELVDRIVVAGGRTVEAEVVRDGVTRAMRVTPDTRTGADGTEEGFLGIGPALNEVRYGVLAAVPEALNETWGTTVLTLGFLKKMIVGQVSVKNLAGPITIAKVAGDSARSGWRFFISILALLSVSLGVLNLLPIPVLDGGHVLYGLAEVVMGRPVSARVEAYGTQVGVVLVGGLMLLAIYNDIARLLW